MAGTDNMETTSKISELQPMSQETISILESAGSSGNSTMRRPVEVRPPVGTEQAALISSWAGPSSMGWQPTPAASTCVIQGPQDPQLVHGVQHIVFRGRIHEVELQQVLHTQGLEQEHYVGKVGALDLRHRGRQQLILVGALGVEPGKRGQEHAPPVRPLRSLQTCQPGTGQQPCTQQQDPGEPLIVQAKVGSPHHTGVFGLQHST